MEHLKEYTDQIIKLGVEYAPKVLLAVVVLAAGWWFSKRIVKILADKLQKASTMEKSVQSFLCSIAEIGIKILVVISVAGIVGIETTSFVGIIAAMGFAVGLALQGNLSNFAAGVLILLNRLYKVGDEIKVQGSWGFVKEIKIFHTVIKNFDKTITIIPNSKVISGSIQNMSATDLRWIALELNIPYTENFQQLKKIICDAALNVPKVDNNQAPRFDLGGFEDHFMKIKLRVFTTPQGYWGTKRAVNEAVLNALIENNVKIAYPIGVTFGEHGKEQLQEIVVRN